MLLLLDTCTFLWLITDDVRLSSTAKELFQSPQSDVYLSSISLWEITVKYKLGKLPLPKPPHEYIPLQRQIHKITSLSLHENAIQHLSHLPDLHKDPFDRMLICQAIEESMTILTCDPLIHEYPVKVVW